MLAGRAAHRHGIIGRLSPGAEVRFEVPVYSSRLGLQGRVDAVEEKWGLAVPVERKWALSGKPPPGAREQLAAAALALEETWGCRVEYGYLETLPEHSRELIAIDAPLRQRTSDLAEQLHTALAADALPSRERDHCGGCSLGPVCLHEETAALREELLAGTGQVDY
jgi:CRISPR-associated exonuclease Cas4